jgi:predicted AAA+ superfamily ATPase
MLILEDLNFTTDQKKKVEDELELAHLKMRKMEEVFKNIEEYLKNTEEDKKRI